MPYADNEGVRIHYRVEGEGPPLVLEHGITQSLDDYYECGYVDALRSQYRLILIDARGHGGSDKPHDPAAYPLATRAADVAAVLDAVRLPRAHFWGHSMGGWIGFGMGQFQPARVDRLVISGAHPYARDQSAFRNLFQAGLVRGVEAFLAMFVEIAGEPPPGYRARLRTLDLAAMLAASEDPPSLEAGLSAMQMPCCLYAGESDPLLPQAQSASRLIPGARFFSLPELTHLQSFVRSDLVLPRVIQFLRQA